VHTELSTSINDIAITETMKLYPNPATTQLYLQLNADASISISDVTGNVFTEERLDKNSTSINISTLSNGTYLLKMITDDSIKIGKFVKQ
jgi:hypothetical protein